MAAVDSILVRWVLQGLTTCLAPKKRKPHAWSFTAQSWIERYGLMNCLQGDVRAGDLGADAEVPDEDAAESSGEEDNAETEDVTDYDSDEERR